MGPGNGLDRCGKSRPTGIRSPDLPARSKSLYRLSYPRSIGNEYQEYFLGGKGGRFMCRLPSNLEASIPCNPQGLSRDCFTFYTVYRQNLKPANS
jgi:hypothetical protein